MRERERSERSKMFCFLNGLILSSSLFIFVFSTWHNSNINWRKHRWCAWDSNPGWQMEGADESTVLWRHPEDQKCCEEKKAQRKIKFDSEECVFEIFFSLLLSIGSTKKSKVEKSNFNFRPWNIFWTTQKAFKYTNGPV